MIHKIGVLCQDRNSFGFLRGIARRLKCEAELIEPSTGGIAKSTRMTRRQAKLAALDFEQKGVDLIVRFTDADRNRWQDIKRDEARVFQAVESVFVCGVAVDNVELWLAWDRDYLGGVLGISELELVPLEQLTGTIKNAIARRGTRKSDVTAEIVANAPPEVFRR